MSNIADQQMPTTAAAREAQLDSEGMDRGVGFLGLLWASEGSIIGSGWLFGALTAASVAGPSAIIGWCIGSVIIILLALVHAELGGLFPVSGGTSRFPHYAFGSLAGATFGWFAYIQAATVAPIEVLAAIQYASSWKFAHSWYNGTNLSRAGDPGGDRAHVHLHRYQPHRGAVAGARQQRADVVEGDHPGRDDHRPARLQLPRLQLHRRRRLLRPRQPRSRRSSSPFPPGIVFSLLGFEQAVQLGGEARNPSKDLPRAVILSILIGGVIYILLQVAFIGALEPKLSRSGRHVDEAGHAGQQRRPLQGAQRGARSTWWPSSRASAWLAFLLRLDAVISPSGTGLIYLTSALADQLRAEQERLYPRRVREDLDPTRVPVLGIIVTAVIGLLFLLPFPSWAKLVGVVTSARVLMYAGAPLALGALRHQKPDLPRPYRLPPAACSRPWRSCWPPSSSTGRAGARTRR